MDWIFLRVAVSSVLMVIAEKIYSKPVPPPEPVITYRYACNIFSKDCHQDITSFLNSLNSNIEDIHAVQMDVNYVLIITKIRQK
jgi:hypothetical protein